MTFKPTMTLGEVVGLARVLLKTLGENETSLAQNNFLDFCEQVRTAVLGLPPEFTDSLDNFREFSECFRKYRDDFAHEVSLDPCVLYVPKHHVAEEFHRSPAWIRYYYGGNRISKTQAGTQEDYWCVTGQHPWRPKPAVPSSVFIIGSNFSKYAVNVFEKKFISGEGGNPLSPVFPVGGRWLHSYDDRKHLIRIACRECSLAGRASSCHHQKSTIVLFSDVEGPGVLAGGQYALGHFDEQIREEFFAEAKQRIKTVPNSGLIVTETPIYGRSWWTYTQLYQTAQDKEANVFPGSKRQIVSLHTIDQFSAGLTPHETILADMKTMSDPEIEARIYGRHVAASEMAVFDLQVLHEMRDELKEPTQNQLILEDFNGSLAEAIKEKQPTPQSRLPLRLRKSSTGLLKIWAPPKNGVQYIIGADVSQGLTKRDASAAQVLKITDHGAEVHFEQVAVFHGWINSHAYAEELYKLGHFYNDALLVVEANGPGDAVIQRLKELGCWFIFRDISDPAQAAFSLDARLGIDTNVRTKGLMVSVLQGVIRRWKTGIRAMQLKDDETILQLESYIQEPTPTGLSFRFRGGGSAHDDLVMALALATYVATSYPVINFSLQKEGKAEDLDDREEQIWRAFHEMNKDAEPMEVSPWSGLG